MESSESIMCQGGLVTMPVVSNQELRCDARMCQYMGWNLSKNIRVFQEGTLVQNAQ
jgi:hypothetical protein